MGGYRAAEPTNEELELLELRRKLKDHYRKQLLKQETCTSASTKTKGDDFGSFFGPSQPTIVPRVIKESTSLLHFQVLRVSYPRHGVKKGVNKTCATGSKRPSRVRVTSNVPQPKVDPVKLKLEKMKEARDYSFLFSDDAKSPLRKKVSAPKPDAASSTNIPEKGRKVLKEGKPVSLNGKKMQCSAPRDAKAVSTNIRQKSNSSGHVAAGRERQTGSKMDTTVKADSTAIVKNSVSSGHVNRDRAAGLERQAGLKNVESETDTLDLKEKVTFAKQAVTSANPQTSRPPPPMMKPIIAKPVSSRTSLQDRPKKRPLSRRDTEDEDDGFDYRSAIRAMFRYNPDKYRDSDRDTRDMEAGFHDILKEERKSALIARKEDQIEQKRIEDEARKERLHKEAKRRKLSQS